MANEQSLLDMLKAIEAWSLEVAEEVKKREPNYDTILQNLKNINREGRRIAGFGGAIKTLQDNKVKNELKTKIASIRAVAMKLHGDLRSEPSLNRAMQRYTREMVLEAVESVKIVETLSSNRVNFSDMASGEKRTTDVGFNLKFEAKSDIISFFEGEGKFSHLDQKMRRVIWGDYISSLWEGRGYRAVSFNNLKLEGCDLSGFNFMSEGVVMTFENCSFKEIVAGSTDFSNCRFYSCTFENSSFKNCNFSGIELRGLLIDTNFSNSDFSNSNYKKTSISVSVKNVNFDGAIFEKVTSTEFSNSSVGGGKRFSSFKNANFRGAIIKCGYILDEDSFAGADLTDANIFLMKEDFARKEKLFKKAKSTKRMEVNQN